MVRYLGNFSHREPRPEEDTTEMTFNILLEYGDFDLEDYLYGTAQPIFPWEIINFWKSLFDVADAVEGIHNLKIPNGSGGFRKYNGWHADIKPDNILSVRGTFKLADPGFAKFQKHTGKEATEMILGGTQTYGAPERNPDRRGTLSEVSQKIDTWSLGCVFSEVATWVILGWQGVLQFRRLRKNATKAIMDSRKHASLKRIHRLKAGDYFHDGRDVLEIVKKWHETLRRLLRMGTTDPITIQVLDLIDSKMLVGPPAERKRIEDICKDLRDIERTTSEPPLELPDGIMEALVEMDAAAPAHIASEKRRSGIGVLQHHQTHGSLTIAEEREARKSKMLGEPMMKTAHRSEYRKSAITRLAPTIEVEGGVPLYESPVEDLEGDDGLKISMDPSTPAKAAPMRKKGGLSPPPPLPHSPPELSREQFTSESQSEPLIRTVTRRPRPARRRTTVSQDVFQAREEVEKREKGNVFRKTRKDQLLSGHFKHRDIKFLVDNAESMKKHWYEAKYLLETLLMKAAGQDDDGADMSFTVGNCQVKGKKDKKEFMKAMNVASPTEGHNTDMKMALGEIFNDYLNQLKTHKKFPHLPMKNLTLIVFTDGIWAGMRNKEDVFHKIVAFVREVDEIGGKMKERPVSIEFIQFGDDADATHRLRRLDDDMPWHGVR
ncbi:kinase-like protein [Patellaria atrata CBS 101060]|uniref:Kinase-like protein n=1 Tax=Patellaria atrata CBS 101060 TaxID=1346257 RepID=A0A9P4SHH0_9PEZI|nr:kinase-like protein [Patellaria atrata CBS 101060]